MNSDNDGDDGDNGDDVQTADANDANKTMTLDLAVLTLLFSSLSAMASIRLSSPLMNTRLSLIEATSVG